MRDPDQDKPNRRRRGSMLDLAPDRSPLPPDAERSDSLAGDRSPPEFRPRTPKLSTRRFAGRTGEPSGSGEEAATAAERSFRAHLTAQVTSLLDRASPGGRDVAAPADDARIDGWPADHDAGAPAAPSPTDNRTFGDPGDRPLIDPALLVGALWRYRLLIGAATAAGAVAGVLIALSTPHEYYAETKLFIDPREIRLTESDLRNELLSTEAMIAMTDSQVQILTSNSVLVEVVDELGLGHDAEFNGNMSAGGIAAGIQLIRELVTGRDAEKEGRDQAISHLRDALHVSRDPRTFVINVGVVTRDPERSALIVNTVVDTYLDGEGDAQSGLMERTSEAIDSRLEALRADLNAAERAVESYRAENDLVGVGGELLDDKHVLALTNQLANARAAKVAARVKADNLRKAELEEVIGGAFPEEFLSANLVDLRKQYSQAKANADSLAAGLGPRHPRYVAATSSMESTREQIRTELRRIVASSQSELQRAVETEQEVASQLAVAKTRSLHSSEELVTLRELERKAAATRQIYEAFLKRSREVSERGNLSTQSARIISHAEPPLQPDGPSRKFIALGGMAVGMAAGVGFALLMGTIESLRGALPGLLNGTSPRPRGPRPQGGRRRQEADASESRAGDARQEYAPGPAPHTSVMSAPAWEPRRTGRPAPAGHTHGPDSEAVARLREDMRQLTRKLNQARRQRR